MKEVGCLIYKGINYPILEGGTFHRLVEEIYQLDKKLNHEGVACLVSWELGVKPVPSSL